MLRTTSFQRHNISEQTWALLAPQLPGRNGFWGGKAKDNQGGGA